MDTIAPDRPIVSALRRRYRTVSAEHDQLLDAIHAANDRGIPVPLADVRAVQNLARQCRDITAGLIRLGATP